MWHSREFGHERICIFLHLFFLLLITLNLLILVVYWFLCCCYADDIQHLALFQHSCSSKLKYELAALDIIHQSLLSKEFPDMLWINKLIFLSHREERAPWQSGTTGSPSVTTSLGCTNRAVLKCRPINQTPRPKELRIDSFSPRAKSWRSKFASSWQFFLKYFPLWDKETERGLVLTLQRHEDDDIAFRSCSPGKQTLPHKLLCFVMQRAVVGEPLQRCIQLFDSVWKRQKDSYFPIYSSHGVRPHI